MIVNRPFAHKVSMIDQITRSFLNFYLTGSRYFGNDTNDSDWDFFVEFQDGLRDWLEDRGFESQGADYGEGNEPRFSIPKENKLDPTIQEVWMYENPDTKEKIHIQIIKPGMITLKQAVQDIISSNNLMCLAPRIVLGGDITNSRMIMNPMYKELSKAIWISVMRTLISISGRRYPGL
jgi:hypothetical protein